MCWQAIEQSISEATARPFTLAHKSSLSGGSINTAFQISDDNSGSKYFVKRNDVSGLSMFEAEADGLRDLAAAQAIRTPEPVCTGVSDGHAWLVTEYIQLARGQAASAAMLGQQLAELHRTTSESFGWFRDNTIGSTPQVNRQDNNWVSFYRTHRLRFQLDLVARNGYSGSLQDKGQRLMAGLEQFFTSYTPQPSLLHGDLWGGNCSFDEEGRPVIFDPAVYYGDREADIAMTELFGGFSADFYTAYNEAWPLDGGYKVRKTLYNLYHILNHANLFGGGYASQAESMINQLISEMN